jgi:hypothetical protein
MEQTQIDNFLDEESFNKLKDLIISPHFEWYFCNYVATEAEEQDLSSYFFTHVLYYNHAPISSHHQSIKPLFDKIDDNEEIKSLLWVRANCYLNTSTLLEHSMHTDREYSHTAALLSLNTCDGYTKLEDGTKLDSVSNRVIFFNAGEEHCSTTTTNAKARFNIIVNYL